MSVNEVKIRPATEEDLVNIVPMLVSIQGAHVEAFPERYAALSEVSALAFLTKHFNLEQGLWVAELSGQLVGYVMVQFNETQNHPILRDRQWCYLKQIGVTDSVKRSGIGKRLLKKVFQECERRSISDIELDVWSFNDLAESFFQSAGFTQIAKKMAWSKVQK